MKAKRARPKQILSAWVFFALQMDGRTVLTPACRLKSTAKQDILILINLVNLPERQLTLSLAHQNH